jgi:guanosine-3',5'-bis(diphosphate) 3'-pyrophosphohydrolase
MLVWTVEELTQRFGADVAELVAELTDDKSLGKHERKRLQVANVPLKSERAQTITIAYKISNLRSLHSSPPAGWIPNGRLSTSYGPYKS